jgi:transcriptional regulator GlxA family with amidase domain
MPTIRVGVIGYDGVSALDLLGPIEAFSAAVTDPASGTRAKYYETKILGLTGKPFVSESGVRITPHCALAKAPPLDTLIIPGGCGLRRPELQAPVAKWVAARAARIRRIASVCTGIYGLAPTGLLDGRRVTTHWRFARDVARQFPRLEVDPDPLFIKDGGFYTSAGITAGIDLALALIEEDHGEQVALAVARELVVYLKRPGGQEQYSEPLRFQLQSIDQFADLAAWIPAHLRSDLSVRALAARAKLSVRQFSRRFVDEFQITPAAFIEATRLAEGCRRLTSRSRSIKAIASSIGFASADAFRRAFVRQYGIAPSSYRARFGGQASARHVAQHGEPVPRRSTARSRVGSDVRAGA